MTNSLVISPTTARRLAVTRQRLVPPTPAPTSANMLDVVRDIGCLQIDPISAVARSHLLVMFSRVGPYDVADLNKLIYEDRHLFEYWAHCASFVLTEDFPLFDALMREFPSRERTRTWLKDNDKLKRYVYNRIRKHGPLLSRDLEESGVHPKEWVSTGWTSGRNISRMLDLLWIGGKIMVSGRDGIQKQWDLTERVLPKWTPRQRLARHERERIAVLKSIRGLGVGTARHINFHFMRGDYPTLKQTLIDLESDRQIQRVEIKDGKWTWPGVWYLAADDLPLVERLASGEWSPRTTLLSPFDNLICDRARTELMWDFFFRIEIYVPKPKRRWGYYVLPILHGDQLVGRIDPEMDRENNILKVNAVYAESGAPKIGKEVRGAIESLATFLGAKEINYNKRNLPTVWKRELLT
jgi:hypothetical protein